MGDLLKDTMFSDSQKDSSGDEAEKPAVTLKAPIAKRDAHVYEDINNFDTIFQKDPEYTEERKANVVKLRNKEGNEESRRQKFYRRLSFTHKDKSKANLNLRKSREAEDFESLNRNSSDMEQLHPTQPHKISTTSNPLIDQQASTPKTGFAGLFTLTRKGSRRDTPKGWSLFWLKYNISQLEKN